MADTSSVCCASVDQALERGDAQTAATAAQDGLRTVAYDERKSFFMQLCAVLRRRAGTTDDAACVAEAGELLWAMPEFRSSSAATASVSGETLLLAAALATAHATLQQYEQVLLFDRELLQSPAFFTYDGFTAVDRLACVARTLTASRKTDGTRYVDSAVRKGMSLYHGLTAAHARLDDAAQRQQRETVVCAYLFELGCYRQKQKDYLRAFQSFFALHENNKQVETLRRAALCALCICASEGVRQSALRDVLHRGSPATLPGLHDLVRRAYNQQLFRAADTAAVLAAAEDSVPTAVLQDALREHNILLLAKTFDCVYWRSLCRHMDDDWITEGELYDLLVTMVRAQRLSVSIHQDTGFIDFVDGGEAGGRHRVITDADVFNRVAKAAAVVAAARPDLLS